VPAGANLLGGICEMNERLLIVCVLFLCVGIGSVQADKLDELGLTEDGKPIQTGQPVSSKEVILLPSPFGLTAVERSSMDLSSLPDVKSKLEKIVETVLAGPTAEETKAGFRKVFPAGTRSARIVIDKQQIATVYLDFPDDFISSPGKVQANFDWITGSIQKSSMQLPLMGLAVQAKDPKTGKYLSLDTFLPPDNSQPVFPVPDTAVRPDEEPKKKEGMSDPSLLNNYPRVGNGRPSGSLSGKAVYMNPGHGWRWTGTSWSLQRGFYQNNIEDLSNVDFVNQLLFAYCYNAGADVFSVREMDFNTNLVVADNDDGSPTYVETGSGWYNSSLNGYANGHAPYLHGQNPFSYGTNRLHSCVTGSPTAWVTWKPTIPESGWYNIYISYGAYSNRSPEAHYRVNHSGGSTDYYVDQRRRRFTWVFLGNHYFEAGTSGTVVLYNDSTSSAHEISADAVRFGGGMGLVDRGSGTSGRARYDEEAVYQILYSGCPDYGAASGDDMDDGWTYRPRFGRWLKQGAEAYGAPAQDSVFISSHTNGFNGSARGFGTYVYTGQESTWHDRLRNCVHDETFNDLRNGYGSDLTDRGKHFGTYGENNPNNVSNLMPIFLGEWLFHDNAEDMALYHDPKFRMAMARGIYQGIVKFWAAENGSPSTLLPEPPENLRCEAQSTTSVRLEWSAPSPDSYGGHAPTAYKYYVSTHGRAFPAGIAVFGTNKTLNGLTPGETYYFYITATNVGGESFPTETLAVKLPTSGSDPKILIVNGFDKLDLSTRVQVPWSGSTLYRQFHQLMNTNDYIVEHARAIDNYSGAISFDSCEDEVVESGEITLEDYDSVVWIGGVQAEVWTTDPTVDTSFTSSQRTKLTNYLNGGGKLFVSGAEIAWELDRSGGSTWVDTTLKASYVSDDANTYGATGSSGSIFEGLGSVDFDDGNGPTYEVYWPDVLSTVGGSLAAMEYGSGSGTSLWNFDTTGSWQDPNYSGSTNADAACQYGYIRRLSLPRSMLGRVVELTVVLDRAQLREIALHK